MRQSLLKWNRCSRPAWSGAIALVSRAIAYGEQQTLYTSPEGEVDILGFAARSQECRVGGPSTRKIAAANPTRLALLADLPFQGRYGRNFAARNSVFRARLFASATALALTALAALLGPAPEASA